MILTITGAASAVAVLPSLKGRLDGFAMRVPTPNVSVVDRRSWNGPRRPRTSTRRFRRLRKAS